MVELRQAPVYEPQLPLLMIYHYLQMVSVSTAIRYAYVTQSWLPQGAAEPNATGVGAQSITISNIMGGHNMHIVHLVIVLALCGVTSSYLMAPT